MTKVLHLMLEERALLEFERDAGATQEFKDVIHVPHVVFH